MMKSVRLDTVNQLPPPDGAGRTRLVPPKSDYRAQLKRLYLQQSWTELIELTDSLFVEGVNHFWLDVQWYLHQALSEGDSTGNQLSKYH
ncbi:type VI secretion system domain-containing protein [Citrobacter sp. Cu231]|nr:type VI secretion system domain-containing protein [Citrobacter sp. Cu231]MDM2743907.1 type VI secretion system domain-containing protein [Citrobacter sp. Cu231]